jgi:hypothetical protein
VAYNEELEARVSAEIVDWGTTRKGMFGGTAHLLNGNLMCGVHKDYLILRLGEPAGADALKKPRVKPFDITGKAMQGWVMVEKQALGGVKLLPWLTKARKFVSTLPPK